MKKLLLLLICFSVIVSAQITGQYIQVIPSTNASTTGTLGFFEKSNAASAHFVGFAAPDAIAADVRWILPAVDGTPGQALTTNGSKVLSWGAGGGGGSGPPFIDSTSISFNAVDPSKLLRFDLSRITTATTRKMFPQDFDTVVAGTNLNNYWSAHQLLIAHNTYDLGSSQDGWRWGYFATGVDIANGKITIDASSPQIDASNLGTNLKIQGSNIANGNIFLTPGNVAGSSSVRIETARTDIPALIIKQAAGNQSTEIFQIQDSTGLALFGIRGAGVGGGSNNSVAVAGNIAPYNDNLYSLGLSPNRFSKLWVTDIDLTGTCTGCPGTSPPFPDNAALVSNSVTPSKLLIFDASLITAATTRTLKAQDSNYIIAGNNIPNSFSVSQLPNANNTIDIGSAAAGFRWGYFATGVDIANGKITIDASSPQIDASNLGTNLKIQGSNVANGNIFLTPGNVAGSSSVRIETVRTDIPPFIIKQAAGNSSTEVFQIQDSTGLALFGIRGAGVGGGSNNSVAVAGNIAPYNNNLYSLGLSANRFSKLWVTDIDLSGTCTGCPTGGSGAPFPDNAVLIVGAVDATKKSLIENSRITPGFTRKIIPQDFDTVVAGTNLNNFWSITQVPLTDNTYDLGSTTAQWRSGYFGTALSVAGGKLIVQGTGPQINGAGLGGAFVIAGSSTVNGDIYLAPNNLANGTGRVVVQSPRPDVANMILTQIGGDNTAGVFTIYNAGGTPYFYITGGANGTPYAIFTTGGIVPTTNNTANLGVNGSLRFKKLWVTDIDLSGTCTGCPTGGGSSAPFPDNAPIIAGAVDATKKLTIDLQRITSGATRKSIPQDFDTVVAGTNINNFWSTTQLPINNNTIAIGSSSARFSKFWVTDIDLSGICTGCPGGPPYDDNAVLIVGATDATKKLIIENSRITPGTTRKMIPQDFDSVVAGTNINNFWSVAQLPINNNTIPIGSTTARFSKIWLTDADLTGTFTYPVVAYASCPSVFTTPWNVIATAGNRPTGCMQIRDSAARVWNAPVW